MHAYRIEINFKTHFRKNNAHSAIILCEQAKKIKWPPFESLNVLNQDCLSPLLIDLSVKLEQKIYKIEMVSKTIFKHLQTKCNVPVILFSKNDQAFSK